jgi:hypothetical protein
MKERTGLGGNVQVLEVTTRERNVRDDLDLAITGLGDLNVLAEVTDTTFNLDAVVQELLKGGDVEDLVAGGLGSIDHELLRDLLRLLGTNLLFFIIPT